MTTSTYLDNNSKWDQHSYHVKPETTISKVEWQGRPLDRITKMME